MKKTITSKTKKITAAVGGVLSVIILMNIILSSCAVQTYDASIGNKKYATPDSVQTAETAVAAAATLPPTEPPTESPTEPLTEEPATEPYSEQEPATEASTEAPTIEWATVMTMETKCPFEDQWNEGYIVAIDYPDKTYKTFHVELTEEDREVLEHLCMGEFGTGGFIGAALIAQCVKDAMCFDGFKTVEDVRVGCRYDASLDNTPTQEVKNAVSYIFDSDHAAVQHRIMYMYNPNLVSSAFHESQNYIMTYGDVRFFDRWGY